MSFKNIFFTFLIFWEFSWTNINIPSAFLKLSKLLGTNEVFLGHHLDDLKESYFLRKIQSSNALGLSNIFNEKIKGLNFHRPLVNYTKKQFVDKIKRGDENNNGSVSDPDKIISFKSL